MRTKGLQTKIIRYGMRTMFTLSFSLRRAFSGSELSYGFSAGPGLKFYAGRIANGMKAESFCSGSQAHGSRRRLPDLAMSHSITMKPGYSFLRSSVLHFV